MTVQDSTIDLTGEWSLRTEGSPATMWAMEIVFAQDGDELSGTLDGWMGRTELEGELDGDAVEFRIRVETPDGSAFSMRFRGTVTENNKITGRVEAGDGQYMAEFTAERKESGRG